MNFRRGGPEQKPMLTSRYWRSASIALAALTAALVATLFASASATDASMRFGHDVSIAEADEVVSWDPSTGSWSVRQADGAVDAVRWGTDGDVALVGDVDGDGLDDRVVWRPSNGRWYGLSNAGTTTLNYRWGTAGDVPLLGDIDGDGVDDMVIWRPSNGRWYVKSSATKRTLLNRPWGHGSFGDIPLVGDLDGDGEDDIIIWRPDYDQQGNGRFYVKNRAWKTILNKPWGAGSLGDIPLVGDVDGNGADEVVIYRPNRTGLAEWFPMSIDGTLPVGVPRFGRSDYIPLLLDADGDGTDDLATVRIGSDNQAYWEAETVTGHPLFSGVQLHDASATPLAGNFGAGAVVLNEIKVSGTHWFELYNPSDLSVNVRAYTIGTRLKVHTIFSGTTEPDVIVAPGEFFVTTPRFGMRTSDYAELKDIDGTVLSFHSWTAKPTDTWGRCPDGVGEFIDTAARSRGGPNHC